MKTDRVKQLNQHTAVINAPAPNGSTHSYRIDAEDYEEASKYTWSSRPRHNGSFEASAYNPKSKTMAPITLHRLVVKPKSGQQVAFKDGNTRNCRKENLRVYDSVGERLSDFHTCQLPIRSQKSGITHSYETKSGTRYQAGFTKNYEHTSKAGFSSIKAAQEWVLSEKAALCGCGTDG